MDETEMRELIRAPQTIAPRHVESPAYQRLVDAVHARADALLGECHWCSTGYRLSAGRQDWHVAESGGGMQLCERVSKTLLPRPPAVVVWVEESQEQPCGR